MSDMLKKVWVGINLNGEFSVLTWAGNIDSRAMMDPFKPYVPFTDYDSLTRRVAQLEEALREIESKSCRCAYSRGLTAGGIATKALNPEATP